MSERIHVDVSTTKRTLTMVLDPEQAQALIISLTNKETVVPDAVAKPLINALFAIRDGRTIIMPG